MKQIEEHELVSRIKQLAKKLGRTPLQMEWHKEGNSKYYTEKIGGFKRLLQLAGLEQYTGNLKRQKQKPNILVFDIETLPMIVYSWDLYPENIGLEQIIKDWSIASWSAKWLDEKQIHYKDMREKSIEEQRDDKEMLQDIWLLLDKADIVVTQNGKSFDVKKLNARFLKHDMKPPSSYRHYDTKEIAKRYFKFSSNRLAFMTEQFNEKYKKLDHNKFPGFKLWLGCMAGNIEAWKEMEKYNKHDVLSLEELFLQLLPWDKSINWNVYHDDIDNVCSCGSTKFVEHQKDKFTNTSRFERFICAVCGKEHFSKKNELSTTKRKNILA